MKQIIPGILLVCIFSCQKELVKPDKPTAHLTVQASSLSHTRPVIFDTVRENRWTITLFDSCTNEDVILNLDIVTRTRTITRGDTITMIDITDNNKTTGTGITSHKVYQGVGVTIDVFKAVIRDGRYYFIGDETVISHISLMTSGPGNNLTSRAFYKIGTDIDGNRIIDYASFRFNYCR